MTFPSLISLFPSRTVVLQAGSLTIYWYGVLYVVAFGVVIFLTPRLGRYRQLTLNRQQWLELITWGIAGAVIGGRLGYVLFYNPTYFVAHPLDIFKLWQGGMASHGGFIGAALALWLGARQYRVPWRQLADVVVVPVALGLAFGRLGNFINQELYGTVTTLPWGIVIPGVDGLRHPTQLYAIAKDMFIAAICYWHLKKPHTHPGQTTGLFLILYSILRFLIEFIRVQDYPLIFSLSRGQWLTIPLFVVGVWLFFPLASREERAR